MTRHAMSRAEQIAALDRLVQSLHATQTAALRDAETVGSMAGVMRAQGMAACCREWAAEAQAVLASLQAEPEPAWRPISEATNDVKAADDLVLFLRGVKVIGAWAPEHAAWIDTDSGYRIHPSHYLADLLPPEAPHDR